ncbi:MAG: hypothetical protein ALAOOOJD_01385 [bacterium]|nr:hypothetical protein [bacterium]
MNSGKPQAATTAASKNREKKLRAAAASYDIDRQVAAQINPRDSLFMCGFWRSGTTWLQESLTKMLTAKLVFEPLFSEVPEVKALYAQDNYLAERKKGFLWQYMPFCGAPTLAGHPLHRVFDLALHSALSGRWVRIYRNRLDESFRTRVILKCVRAQLCLRAVHNTFALPVIHIYRDPRAVMASAKTTPWGSMFKHLSLANQLLHPDDGRADFFGQWREEIKHYDEGDMVTRLTAYWALTEKFVQHSFADNRARIVFVSYEDLCRRREQVVLEMLQRLNVAPVGEHDFRVFDDDSSSSAKHRRGLPVGERIAGWKKVLSSAEAESIATMAKKFDFEDRLDS